MPIEFQICTDESPEKKPFVRVVSQGNGEVLLSSEGYDSGKESALHMIDLIKQGASKAPIVDLTIAGSRRRFFKSKK